MQCLHLQLSCCPWESPTPQLTVHRKANNKVPLGILVGKLEAGYWRETVAFARLIDGEQDDS